MGHDKTGKGEIQVFTHSVTGARGKERLPQRRVRRFQEGDVNAELYFEGCRGVPCSFGNGKVQRR